LIFKGRTISVFCVEYEEKYPALAFFESLKEKEAKKVLMIFRLIDNKRGMLANKEKIKSLGNFGSRQCFGLKSHQIRFGCYWGKDRTLYLTHGFVKKDNKWPKKELDMLERIVKHANKKWGY